EQGEQLRLQETETLDELGLVHLYRIWAETMAEEFVRTTRFDPLHEAASEQALYDRIPEILNRRRKDPTVTIDLRAGATVHRVTLNRDLLVRKSASFLEQTRALVRSLMEKTGRPQGEVTMLMTHRFARLPGATTLMSGFDQPRLVELEIGASALNTLRIWDQFDHRPTGNGAAFFTSRPWQPSSTVGSPQSEPAQSTGRQPSHLLYRDLAYPITEAPLTIGQNNSAADGGLLIGGQSPEAVRHHCSIRRKGEQVVLTAIEKQEILIDDQPLTGERTALHLGQSVRLGTSGEIIRLIACLKADET
ncbi:MAG: FHA domain-containing protein, partial [Desulfobacterales bacterium]